MNILRAVRLLIIACLLTCVGTLLFAHPGHAIAQDIAGIGVPFAIMVAGLTNHYEDKRKGQELKARLPWYADKQELAQRKRYEEADRRDFERKLANMDRIITETQARLREAELTSDELRHIQKYPVGKGTPGEQLVQLSQQYGLPVTTPVGTHKRALPPVSPGLPRAIGPSVTASKGREYWHRCGSGFFEEVRFCPVHADHSDVSPDTSVRVEVIAEEVFRADEECPAKPEPEYVPEGYNGMLAALLTNIYAWAQDAQEHGGEYEWHMNDAWAKDVAAIPLNLDREKNVNVIGQFQPGVLFGYHVVTGAQFGAPELVAV